MSGYTKSETFGGRKGGGPFADDLTLASRLAGFVIRAKELVDGIQGIYQNCDGSISFGPWHGGGGGAVTRVDFKPDEHITAVEVSAGDFVDRLMVYTNKNPSGYGPFGGRGGAPTRLNIKVGGFFGKQGEYLDQIGFFIPCER
jgi:hypothetical protein